MLKRNLPLGPALLCALLAAAACSSENNPVAPDRAGTTPLGGTPGTGAATETGQASLRFCNTLQTLSGPVELELAIGGTKLKALTNQCSPAIGQSCASVPAGTQDMVLSVGGQVVWQQRTMIEPGAFYTTKAAADGTGKPTLLANRLGSAQACNSDNPFGGNPGPGENPLGGGNLPPRDGAPDAGASPPGGGNNPPPGNTPANPPSGNTPDGGTSAPNNPPPAGGMAFAKLCHNAQAVDANGKPIENEMVLTIGRNTTVTLKARTGKCSTFVGQNCVAIPAGKSIPFVLRDDKTVLDAGVFDEIEVGKDYVGIAQPPQAGKTLPFLEFGTPADMKSCAMHWPFTKIPPDYGPGGNNPAPGGGGSPPPGGTASPGGSGGVTGAGAGGGGGGR
jgi:hypothetical protein